MFDAGGTSIFVPHSEAASCIISMKPMLLIPINCGANAISDLWQSVTRALS